MANFASGIKHLQTSISRKEVSTEHKVGAPLPISLLASYIYILACDFIVKAVIMNFSEERDMSILYLSTKFELDQFAGNTHRHTDKQTDT